MTAQSSEDKEQIYVKVLEDFKYGYYSSAAAGLIQLLDLDRESGFLNPELLEFLATIYMKQGRLDDANGVLDKIFANLPSVSHISISEMHMRLLVAKAGICHASGEFDKALLLYKEALKVLEELNCPDSAAEHSANISSCLGDIYVRQGKYLELEQLMSEARKLDGRFGANLVCLDHRIATMMLAQGQCEAAAALLSSLLDRIDILHQDYAPILHSLGQATFMLSDFEKAESIFLRVLQIYENTLGGEHVAIANTCNLLAESMIVQEKFVEAEQMCRRSLSILANTYGLDHPFASDVFLNLLLALQGQDRNDSEGELIDWAISNVENASGDSKHLAKILHKTAVVLCKGGHYCQAEQLLLRAMSITSEKIGIRDISIFHMLVFLSHCCFLMRKHEQANEYSHDAFIFLINAGQAVDYSLIKVLEMLADLRYVYKDFSACSFIYELASNLAANNDGASAKNASASVDLETYTFTSQDCMQGNLGA